MLLCELMNLTMLVGLNTLNKPLWAEWVNSVLYPVILYSQSKVMSKLNARWRSCLICHPSLPENKPYNGLITFWTFRDSLFVCFSLSVCLSLSPSLSLSLSPSLVFVFVFLSLSVCLFVVVFLKQMTKGFVPGTDKFLLTMQFWSLDADFWLTYLSGKNI